MLRSARDLEDAVARMGFLPFFRNSIVGFSVEEMADPSLWFEKDIEGPWEWKGPVVRSRTCAYGKFFGGKAMYISLEWFASFVAWRRAARPLVPSSSSVGLINDMTVLEAIRAEGAVISSDLKAMFDICTHRRRTAADLVDLTGLSGMENRSRGNALEKALTSLQMSTNICINDFVYPVSRAGQPYGWGLASYSTPEELYGPDFMARVESMHPVVEYRRMNEHLARLLPQASPRRREAIIR